MTENAHNEGRVLWITGLSGSGKSTIAAAAADQLRARGYPEETIAIVEAVTKDPDDGLTYAQRIEGLAASGPKGAIQVKICDLMDNSDPQRLAALPEDKAKSLAKRYDRALDVLLSALNQRP